MRNTKPRGLEAMRASSSNLGPGTRWFAEFGERRLDVTPAGARSESILDWLRNRPTRNCRILDDEPSEFPLLRPAELIVCAPKRGTSDPDVLAAVFTWLSSAWR